MLKITLIIGQKIEKVLDSRAKKKPKYTKKTSQKHNYYRSKKSNKWPITRSNSS